MGRYLIKRFFFSILTLLGLAVICFVLLRLFPGGPFSDDIQLSPRVIEALNQQYGLQLSIPDQLGIYLGKLVRLDFGNSILFNGRPVSSVIASAYPRTAVLGSLALTLSIFFGIIFGVTSFFWGHQTWVRIIHFVFLSAPTFFLGPFLILVFGFWLDLLPVTLNQKFISYLLPVFILSVRPMMNIARLLQNSLKETLLQPWVNVYRSYGFSEAKIISHFALRLSVIPLFSYLGSLVASLLSGSILVEIIFNVQGLGSLFIDSLINRDYPLIMALTLIYGFILISSNLCFDLFMYSLDPRMEQA